MSPPLQHLSVMYVFLFYHLASLASPQKRAKQAAAAVLLTKKRGSCNSERLDYKGMRAINVARSDYIQHQVHGFGKDVSEL